MGDRVLERPPEWVFFDVGETLIRPWPSFAGAIVDICASEGIELSDDEAHAVADARLRKFLDFVRELEGGSFSDDPKRSRNFWTKFYQGFLGEMGMEFQLAEQLSAVIYDEMTQPHRYKVFDDAAPLLELLAGYGIKMAVVSNWEAFLDEMLDGLGIGRHFEVRVISGIEGIEKPDPEIFRRALERACVHPSSVVHIGDDPRSDAEPASKLGMGAIIIDRRNRHPERRWPTVETLLEVPYLLGLS